MDLWSTSITNLQIYVLFPLQSSDSSVFLELHQLISPEYAMTFFYDLTATFLIVTVSFVDDFQHKSGAGCSDISIGRSLSLFRVHPMR